MTELEELTRDLNHQIIENMKLKAKIRQQEEMIKQLRSTLAKLGVDAVTEVELEDYEKLAKKGRPVLIDDATRQRIRRLKEEGMAYREIAKREGVSLGMVSRITNEN